MIPIKDKYFLSSLFAILVGLVSVSLFNGISTFEGYLMLKLF